MKSMQRLRNNTEKPLQAQIEERVNEKVKKEKEYGGSFDTVISTGSTLLDLAISGGRIRGGGLCGGILVEIFGPSGCGKTVLLSEIAGAIQRKGGDVMFHDPEARLNKQFAKLFDLDTDKIEYTIPNTIPEVFSSVRSWKPKTNNTINAVIADSLAALSTDMEMESKDGDKMGMRRAKEFSEELRKTCRILTQNNLLMICSNQVRVNMDAGPYGQKYITPGGESVGFYSSLRLRASKPEKIKAKVMVANKEIIRVTGVRTELEVFKSSIWKPYHIAPVTILFDYGIDDIRENLQFIKDYTKNTMYCLGYNKLSNSMEEAISIIEESKYERKLRRYVIDLWEEIETKFEKTRKPKQR